MINSTLLSLEEEDCGIGEFFSLHPPMTDFRTEHGKIVENYLCPAELRARGAIRFTTCGAKSHGLLSAKNQSKHDTSAKDDTKTMTTTTTDNSQTC